jgi:hypothetical protein
MSKKGKMISGIVVGLSAIGTVLVFAEEKIDKAIVTEKELTSVVKVIQDGRNIERLGDLQRDLIGEKYNNEGEKLYLVEEIKRLQKQLLCSEKNKCE